MVFLPGKVLKFLLMMSSAARSRRRADVNFRETMGAGFASLRNLFTRREARVLIMGLDAAGKTTILYKWKLGEIVTTIPTIGFNVEQIASRNFTITAWDVGGRDKIRPLWRHYFQGTTALVFVIDSNDRDRLDAARDELWRNLNEAELAAVPLLVIANKQDLPRALSAREIAVKLGLEELRARSWHLQPCTATSGEGLQEALDWLDAEHSGDERQKAAAVKAAYARRRDASFSFAIPSAKQDSFAGSAKKQGAHARQAESAGVAPAA